MKKSLIFILVILVSSCQDNVYDRLRNYIETLEIVDDHEHMRTPYDSVNFCLLNAINYFPGDLYSAGAPGFPEKQVGRCNMDSIWDQYAQYYAYCRATSYHDQFMNTLRILYDFDKAYLTKEDVLSIYDKMYINHYRNYPAWFKEVYQKGRFKTMVVDRYWDHFNTKIDTSYFSLVCNINSLVLMVGEAAENKKIDSNKGLLNLMNHDRLILKTLDDFIAVTDSVLDKFKASGAVCVKNTLAYSRSIDFEDIDYADAKAIYGKSVTLSDPDRKKLEDFVFHHIVQQSIKLEMPIQIHTGYLAGNNSRLDNGHPMKLLNLLIKYPEAKFILFHGGYPWVGDYAAIGKQFTNVYLDIVWLPQISKTAAIHGLHEILDAVPYNKLFWGGDVTNIDDAIGSLELGKEVVATVLAERVERGWITEDLARDIAKAIFYDNGVEMYQLKI
jgi:hypothetical protein